MVKIDKKIVGWEVVKEDQQKQEAPRVKLERPEVLSGKTYKLKAPTTNNALYITINDDETGRPFEIFINSKDSTHSQWTTALSLNWSALFRREKDLSFLIKDLKSITDPNGGYWSKGKYVPSLAAAIGYILERHLESNGLIEKKELDPSIQAMVDEKKEAAHKGANSCPDCGGEVVRLDGCATCLSCGRSHCG